jgi:hypothetical protein
LPLKSIIVKFINQQKLAAECGVVIKFHEGQWENQGSSENIFSLEEADGQDPTTKAARQSPGRCWEGRHIHK